jgi:hypothetical protein
MIRQHTKGAAPRGDDDVMCDGRNIVRNLIITQIGDDHFWCSCSNVQISFLRILLLAYSIAKKGEAIKRSFQCTRLEDYIYNGHLGYSVVSSLYCSLTLGEVVSNL